MEIRIFKNEVGPWKVLGLGPFLRLEGLEISGYL